MTKENEALKEIEFIIDNDTVNSTYKFALCKGAIEISRNHAEKAFLSYDTNRVIFPFSYMIAYFIRYYYPIFGYSSFIPQLNSESQKNSCSSQSAFRGEFDTIIGYYSDHGGFNVLWDDIKNDTIPSLIQDEWKNLCRKVHDTILYQPMKYFGRKNRKSLYSVFKSESDFPIDDVFEDFPTCSINGSFFSFPFTFHEIFQDISDSTNLIEKIHRRWCSFSISLVDGSDISSEQFMKILSESNPENSRLQGYTGDNVCSELQLSQIIQIINHSLSKETDDNDCHILSHSAEEVMLSLRESIERSHQKLMNAEAERIEAEKEFKIIESETERAEKEFQILYGQYGLNNPPRDIFLNYLKNQKNEANHEISASFSENEQKKRDLVQKNEKLRKEIKILEYSRELQYQKVAEIEKKHLEIIQLNEEKNASEKRLIGRPSAFGHVGKPIKRFFTHCDDIASEFLLKSINLFLAKKEPCYENETTNTLPEWFVSAFETWWEEKENALHKRRTGGGTASRNPTLIIDYGHREITLIIPAQHIQSKRPLDEVVFVVQSSSEIIYESIHPLYHEDDGYVSEEIILPISVPSDTYHVEMISVDSSKRFPPIEVFSEQKKYACFDYETGRLMSNSPDTLDRSACVVFSEPIAIHPDSAIIESGRFYGSWYGYFYYFVDPQYSDRGIVTIGSATEIGENVSQRYPSVTLENYQSLDKIRINNKTVISGSPPSLVLSLPSQEELSSYRLSIHPLSPGTISETRVYSYNEFKDHCVLDKTDSVCRFNLADEVFFGEKPVGTFAVRLRNEQKNLDQIFEFSIIPELSVSFSKPLYLPGNDNGPVLLTMTSAELVNCSAEEPVIVKRKNDSWILSGPVVQNITGTLKVHIPGKEPFSGIFSVPVPHLSWRFENPEKEIIGPIHRTKVTVSDDKYDELGDGKTVTVFMPEEYNGIGTITLKPSDNYIIKNIQNGKAIFSLSRFNDTLREIQDTKISFRLSFESQKERFEIPLFTLKKWRISAFKCQVTTEDENRTMTFSWQETGDVQKRSLIIWKAGLGDSQPQKNTEISIPDDARSLSISKARNLIPPGVYYAQFIRIQDEWSSTPVLFPGEQTPNFFQFSVELKGSELLNEGDELLSSGQYIAAIEQYKELEHLNSQLGSLWKQKIQNTFMYTYRYDEVLNLFKELMLTTHYLKAIDYPYITFRVVASLKKPEEFTYNTFLYLFQVVTILLKMNDKTSKSIILNHLQDFENAMNACPNLEDDQIARINEWIKGVKHLVGKKD